MGAYLQSQAQKTGFLAEICLFYVVNNNCHSALLDAPDAAKMPKVSRRYRGF
jgi:hypothetical protein